MSSRVKTIDGTARINLTGGLKKILSRDSCQQLINAVEEAAPRMTFTHLRKAMKATQERWGAGWIHASDLSIPCDRVLTAPLLGLKPETRYRPPVSRRILDNGTYMHLRYQANFHALRKPFKVHAPLHLFRWPIVGEADVAVEHPDLGNWIVELKSMNSYQLKQLNSPKEDHLGQLGVYLGLAGAKWQGQIWYENKNDQEIKPWEVVNVPWDWRDVWARASRIANELLEGYLPKPCGSCVDPEFCNAMRPTKARLEKLNAERTRSYPSS